MKTTSATLSFDQTFEGFLTAVHTAFAENLELIDLRPSGDHGALLFSEVRHIRADRQKAQQVWEALSQKGTADLRLVYFAFLSEKEELYFPIYEYLRLLFKAELPESSHKFQVLRTRLACWAQRVESEKRRLEASLRLQSQYGEFRCCRLCPRYDVLPLLTRYCRIHYGSEPWMLIDTKRRYGLRKRATGIERFPLSVEGSGMQETSAQNLRRQSEATMAPQAVHSLQAAV
ncbi:MAG: DUF4130 domain-containing protein [Robiginitalea sp.]|nr:DUF4130 domain-containing protein [Robiginitalea sp.]